MAASTSPGIYKCSNCRWYKSFLILPHILSPFAPHHVSFCPKHETSLESFIFIKYFLNSPKCKPLCKLSSNGLFFSRTLNLANQKFNFLKTLVFFLKLTQPFWRSTNEEIKSILINLE